MREFGSLPATSFPSTQIGFPVVNFASMTTKEMRDLKSRREARGGSEIELGCQPRGREGIRGELASFDTGEIWLLEIAFLRQFYHGHS